MFLDSPWLYSWWCSPGPLERLASRLSVCLSVLPAAYYLTDLTTAFDGAEVACICAFALCSSPPHTPLHAYPGLPAGDLQHEGSGQQQQQQQKHQDGGLQAEAEGEEVKQAPEPLE